MALTSQTETAVNDLLKAVSDNARFYAPDPLLATDEFHRGQMVAEAEYRIFVQALGTEVTNRLHRVLRPLLKEGIELQGGVGIGNLSLIRDAHGEVTSSIDLYSDESPVARVLFNEVEKPLGNNYPNWLVINRLPRKENTSIFLNYLMASSYIPEGITKQDISCIIQQKDFEDFIQVMDFLRTGLASELAMVARNNSSVLPFKGAILKALEIDGGLPGMVFQEAFTQLMQRHLAYLHGRVLNNLPMLIDKLDCFEANWGERDLSDKSFSWRMALITQEMSGNKAVLFTDFEGKPKSSIIFIDTDSQGKAVETHLYTFTDSKIAVDGVVAFMQGEPIPGVHSSYRYGEDPGLSHFDSAYIRQNAHEQISDILHLLKDGGFDIDHPHSRAELFDDFAEFLEDHGILEHEYEEKSMRNKCMLMG